MYDSPFHQENLSDYTFLISGGAGFIGSNIVEYLLKYDAGKVIVMDNFATGLASNLEAFKADSRLQVIEADIADYDSCLKATKGVDFISHQAALGSVPRSINNPIATNLANVNGFINMMTAARENGVKRVVYASSSSVYGDSKQLPKEESVIGTPISPYAVSKYTNELYASVFNQVYGQQILGLRYFNVFGPRQNPQGPYAAVIPLFVEALLKGESPFINGDGGQTRDFTFVENAVQANIKGMFCENEKAYGEVFNVAVGERLSLLELFAKIQQLTNSTVPAFHREERAGDVRDSLANIDKAAKLLAYYPQVKIDEGLAITVDWFRQHFNF